MDGIRGVPTFALLENKKKSMFEILKISIWDFGTFFHIILLEIMFFPPVNLGASTPRTRSNFKQNGATSLYESQKGSLANPGVGHKIPCSVKPT